MAWWEFWRKRSWILPQDVSSLTAVCLDNGMMGNWDPFHFVGYGGPRVLLSLLLARGHPTVGGTWWGLVLILGPGWKRQDRRVEGWTEEKVR